MKAACIASPNTLCLTSRIADVISGFCVFGAQMPCPVKGMKISKGAAVVATPNTSPFSHERGAIAGAINIS